MNLITSADIGLQSLGEDVVSKQAKRYGCDEVVCMRVECGKSVLSSQMLTPTSLDPYAWMLSTRPGVRYLLNIFEVFLPQLLLYPNPSDPLNGDAASLMMKDKQQYDQKVKEYCERYAKKEHVTGAVLEDSSDEDVSESENNTSSDDEVAGHVDP
ncbi:hypothetical protein ACLOJK_035351 [Asimina triloba]